MKISIAMATYNGEKYIEEQLESIASQTLLPDELVITDDCSTDNTVSIIKNFKKKSPFQIRLYINNKNLNYTQNFNKAIELCENELIFLSDQDDVWFPNKIEYIVDLAKKYPNKDLFMNDAELVDKNLCSSGLTKLGQIKNAGFEESHFVMGCCIAVRKSYLDLVIPIPNNFKGHDDWIVRLSDFLNLRLIDKTVLQYYRRHGENESKAIYNSLTEVSITKPSIFEKFIKWYNFSKIDFYQKKIQELENILIGLKRMKYHKSNNGKIEILINKMEVDLMSLKQRYRILSAQNTTDKIKYMVLSYVKGTYPLKSLISDLIKNG